MQRLSFTQPAAVNLVPTGPSRKCIRPSANRQRVVTGVGSQDVPVTTAGTVSSDSGSLQDLLKSPFDVATFGPRLAFGALLSAQESARSLQSDIDKAATLLQGPRPNQEKQEILLKELEIRVASYVQRGAAVEAEFLTAMSSLLPADVQKQLPPQLKDILLRGTTNKRVSKSPPTVEEAQAIPIATVAKNQTAAEMVDLRESVADLRQAMIQLNTNKDPSQEGVLKVNIVDARSGLSRKLQQLSPAARSLPESSAQAALTEASILLREAEALRL